LAPVPGAIVNIRQGKNVVGEPNTPMSIVNDLVGPLAPNDIYEVMQDQGIPKGTAFSLLAILGVGLQTYDPEKRSGDTRARERRRARQ